MKLKEIIGVSLLSTGGHIAMDGWDAVYSNTMDYGPRLIAFGAITGLLGIILLVWDNGRKS